MITELIDAFDDLQHQLHQLAQHLTASQPAHWIPLNPTEEQMCGPLDFACELLCDLWYRGHQDGRETRSRHGLIQADSRCIELIHGINAAKDHFRALVQQEKQDLPTWKNSLQQLTERPSDLRDKLSLTGLSRIHLKQCFRHIPILEQAPVRVGFSWYVNGRSIRKLTLAEAEAMLLDLGEDKAHIQIQLEKLGMLPPGTLLARIQNQAPVVRANLVFGQPGAETRKAMNVALPLFIAGDNGILPQHNRISPEPPPGRTRQARGDQRISDEPYLPSLRAYTYRADN